MYAKDANLNSIALTYLESKYHPLTCPNYPSYPLDYNPEKRNLYCWHCHYQQELPESLIQVRNQIIRAVHAFEKQEGP